MPVRYIMLAWDSIIYLVLFKLYVSVLYLWCQINHANARRFQLTGNACAIVPLHSFVKCCCRHGFQPVDCVIISIVESCQATIQCHRIIMLTNISNLYFHFVHLVNFILKKETPHCRMVWLKLIEVLWSEGAEQTKSLLIDIPSSSGIRRC